MSINEYKDAVEIVFNVVSGCADASITEQKCNWSGLREIFSVKYLRKGCMSYKAYHAADDGKRKEDKDGPAFIPCSAKDSSGTRNQSNMDKLYLLILDIDDGMRLDDVKSRIAGYEALIHSSHSHTPEKPKWRVILPLLSPIPAKDAGRLFDHFQARFDGVLDAKCGHDSSHLYYLPSCPADSEDRYICEHMNGEMMDAKALLMYLPVGKLTALPSHVVPTGASGGADKGNRNNAIFKVACQLFEEGHSLESVNNECLTRGAAFDPPLDVKEILATVASANKTVTRKELASVRELDEIVSAFNDDFAWVEKQGRVWRVQFRDFVHFDQLRQQFANTRLLVNVGGSDKWLSHAEIWQRSDKRRTHVNVNFFPGKPEIVDNCINLWSGWGVTALGGDIKPWKEFLDYIFGGDLVMRHWFEQWLAYPIQNPGAKMTTAAVLWSAKQGVGKSMIGETIGKLYGSHFRTVSSMELHSSFNGWMRDCQFVLGEENSSSDQRSDANRLKFLITGATISVNEKHQPAIELNNCANFLFTSNHADAFYLEDADRRFFIWEIAAERKPNEFYERFVDWRDNGGGLGIIMHHLLNIDLTGFAFKGNAPVTEAKSEMIRHSKTELERWISDGTEDSDAVKAVFGKQIVHIDEVTEIYCRERRTRVTTTAVSKALRRQHNSAKRRVIAKGRRQILFSLFDHDKWDKADSAEWAEEFERPTPISL